MSSRIYFSKRNPCPACGSGTKGCSHDTHSLIYLCRGNYSDNFHCFGEKNGFSILKEREDYILSAEEYKANERQREIEKESRKKAEKERIAKFLPPSDRNRKLQVLSSRLSLKSNHKQDLINRGVTNFDWFKSIEQWQIISDIDLDRVPGFIPVGGNSYKYVNSSGMLCPALDVDGNYVGFQIKTDNAEDGKYKWVRSGEFSSHLNIDGVAELPINVNYKAESPSIWLCEGILKPRIASDRHNITVIGGSGNTFPEKTLAATLNKLNPLKNKRVVIAPDSGCLAKDGVTRGNINLFNQVRALGHPVAIADWGQFLNKGKVDLKVKGDIDEIDSLSNVRYLTYEEFIDYKDNPDSYVKEWALSKDRDVRSLMSWLEVLVKKSDKIANSLSKNLIKAPKAVEGDWYNYKVGKLPDPSEGVRRIEFEKGQHHKIYEEACRKGYPFILDLSQTGAGKTHGVANMTPSNCFTFEDEKDADKLHKLIYTSQQSRNPSLAKLESDWVELPARAAGWVHDKGKKTPLGNPVRLQASLKFVKGMFGTRQFIETEYDEHGNCHWSPKFVTAKDYFIKSDICGLCPHKHSCKSKDAKSKDYGYKFLFKNAMCAPKVRANMNSLTTEMVTKLVVLIIDEPNLAVEWLHSHSVSEKQFINTVNRIRGINHPFSDQFVDYLSQYSKLFSFIEDKEFLYEHGMTASDVKLAIADLTEEQIVGFSEIVELVEAEVDAFNEKAVRKAKKYNYLSKSKLISNWLPIFWEWASGKNPHTSITAYGYGANIHLRNQRALDVIHNAHATIFQDATASVEELALKLGVAVEDILVIRSKQDVPSNVNVIHVRGMGKLSKSGGMRSQELKTRVLAIRQQLNARHNNNVGYIDYKDYNQPGDLTHFSTGRGSNLFEKKSALCIFGAPYANLTALREQYEVFTGKPASLRDAGLQIYVNSQVSSEILQEIGRIRWSRRSGEQLPVYICGDVDLTFLQDLGFNTSVESAADISIYAATSKERYASAVFEFVQNFAANADLDDLNQETIAQSVGRSASWLSKLAKPFGGFQQFKKAIVAMVIKSPEDIVEGDLTKIEQSHIEYGYNEIKGMLSIGMQLDTVFEQIIKYVNGLSRDGVSYNPLEMIFSSIPYRVVGEILQMIVANLSPPEQEYLYCSIFETS